MQRLHRVRRELAMLSKDPAAGVTAWLAGEGEDISQWEADITGPADSPYERGIFRLEIVLPERYPIMPPKVRFVTPVYHPNIDNGGRICLDTLKLPPKGGWTPSLTTPATLTMIRLLLAHPNADDGLMPEITHQYRRSRSQFEETARAWTEKYARAPSSSGTGDTETGASAAAAGAGCASPRCVSRERGASPHRSSDNEPHSTAAPDVAPDVTGSLGSAGGAAAAVRRRQPSAGSTEAQCGIVVRLFPAAKRRRV